MENTSIPVEFTSEGKHYKGWAIPSKETDDNDNPKSYRVLLNDLLFGDLYSSFGKWMSTQGRSSEMVASIGECLDKVILPES